MYLTKNNIYNHRFKSLKLIFVLENAHDADDRVRCLDMDTYDVVYLNANVLWDDVVDVDQIDTYVLQCELLENAEQKQEEKVEYHSVIFSNTIKRFIVSEKSMTDRDLALSDIDFIFFRELDRIIATDIHSYDYLFIFSEFKAVRLAHARARDTIWQTGAIII